MDRASAFSDDETLDLLRKHYIAFAPSLTELLKARDSAGDFFRKVVNQRPEPRHSKQGYYICSPDGTLLKGWMYPRPDDGTMKRYLREVLQSYQAPQDVAPLDTTRIDRHATPLPPEGGLVLDVYAKLLDAKWQPTNVERYQMIRDAVGRDRMWVTRVEMQDLLKGTLPDSLLERMIRYHLVDNTRGVHTLWQPGDLKSLHLKVGGKLDLEGDVTLEEAGNRRYDARLKGVLETNGQSVTRFDVLVRGTHSASTTRLGELPVGTSTLVVAFTLAEPGESSRVPPLYSWLQGDYLKTAGLRVSELRRVASR